MKKNLKSLFALILTGAFAITVAIQAQDTPEQARIKELEAKIKALEAGKAAEAPATAAGYEKGLWLNIWQYKQDQKLDTDIPKWQPLGSVAVTEQPFSPGVIKDDNDYKKYFSQPLYFGLEGYIKITKPGVHTLTVDIEYTGNSSLAVTKYSIYLEGNRLTRSSKCEINAHNKTVSISTDADLVPGMYKIQIPFDMCSDDWGYQKIPKAYSDVKISISMKEPGSRRPRTLNDADLFRKD